MSGGATALVAVKTLKPGATAQTREDFMRESELMADLRHPNIVCLIGVVTKDEPRYSYPIQSFLFKGTILENFMRQLFSFENTGVSAEQRAFEVSVYLSSNTVLYGGVNGTFVQLCINTR